MTAYVIIADSEIDPESPGTSTLFTKLRDNPIAIAEGSTGAPALAGPAGASLVLLNTAIASSDASIAFTGLSSTYDLFKLVFINIYSSSAADNLRIRTSTDNGATYEATGYVSYRQDSVTTTAAVTSGNTTGIFIATSVDNTASRSLSGEFNMYGLSSSVARQKFIGECVFQDGSGNTTLTKTFAMRNIASDVDAIEIAFGTGNITGDFYLYGIRKA